MTDASKRVVILGATSGIAEAAARIWAARGARFGLVARNAEKLSAVAADLKARGAELTDAGFFVQARLDREPFAGVELPSRRSYLLAQRR